MVNEPFVKAFIVTLRKNFPHHLYWRVLWTPAEIKFTDKLVNQLRKCGPAEKLLHPSDLEEFREIFLHYEEYEQLESGPAYHKLLKIMFGAKYRAEDLEYVYIPVKGITNSFKGLPQTIHHATYFALFGEEFYGL